MANAAPDPHKALGDFLTWEADQPERWEFLAGQARMMTGGSEAHTLIRGNLVAALKRPLKGTRCRVYPADMKIVTPQGDALYPDVSVSCGPPEPQALYRHDPIVVVEVLSPSSEADDYGRICHRRPGPGAGRGLHPAGAGAAQ
jgi:Uma2 family endonuclease